MGDPPTTSEWAFPNAATPAGSSAYYAIRFAPADRRDDLAALLGWRHQVRSVLDRVSDRGVAARTLRWWSEELERIFAGRGQHPLAARLGPLVARAHLPLTPFVDLIWGTEALLTDRRAETFDDLADLADLDQGALFELIARVHGCAGATDPGATDPGAADLGIARRGGVYCGLVELLRDSGLRVRQGRGGFLPADRLRRLGLDPGRSDPEAIRAGLPDLVAALADDLARRRDALDREIAGPPSPLPAMIRIRIRHADALLARIAAAGFRVADHRIALTPIRKLWIAWRESRRTGRGPSSMHRPADAARLFDPVNRPTRGR